METTLPIVILQVISLAAAVDVITNMGKDALAGWGWYTALGDNWKRLITQAVAAVAGEVLAFGFLVNLATVFPGFQNAPAAAGVFITGIVMSFGSKGLQAVFDAIFAFTNHQQAKAENARADANTPRVFPEGATTLIPVSGDVGTTGGRIAATAQETTPLTPDLVDQLAAALAAALIRRLDSEGLVTDAPDQEQNTPAPSAASAEPASG